MVLCRPRTLPVRAAVRSCQSRSGTAPGHSLANGRCPCFELPANKKRINTLLPPPWWSGVQMCPWLAAWVPSWGRFASLSAAGPQHPRLVHGTEACLGFRSQMAFPVIKTGVGRQP